MRALRSLALVPVLVLAAAACSEDGPAGPTQEGVAGSYEATILSVTVSGTTTDALAEGASLDITLRSGGTTAGTFVVPASLSESGDEVRLDLEGTWSLSGDSVTFRHEADTFLRDMALRVAGPRLEGEKSFGEETVRVVLTRE